MKRMLAMSLTALLLAACGGADQGSSASPAGNPPRGSAGPTPTVDRTPTEPQIASYAQSVGITVACAKAYIAAHDSQFPSSLKDLSDFKSSAPPTAQCG